MKFLLSSMLLLQGSFSYACPDVSGEYRGLCYEVSSCYGTRPVRYSAKIKQNNCSSVEMSLMGSAGPKVFFEVDKNNPMVTSNGTVISTFVTYSATDMVRIEKVSGIVSIETIRKVMDAGSELLEVDSQTKTPSCKVSVNCRIPAI